MQGSRVIAACLIGLVAIFGHACASEEEPPAAPECSVNQFRACTNPEGVQGHEQCVEPGVWSGCIPSVFDDAAYPDVGSDAHDSGADGPEDAGQDAEDAEADSDAATDAEADAGDGSDADGA